MSLQEKLKTKKVEVIKAKTEQTEAAKQAWLKEWDERIAAKVDKRKTIATLSEGLKKNYEGGRKGLEEYKDKKESLKKTYEEYKDVLEEEGIHDFSGMLEENKNEPEVTEYRQLGGRMPSRGGDQGKTGRLYRQVESIDYMKDKLLEAVPDLKLNFTGGKKGEGEEATSQREESFKKIEEYLVALDAEILDMTNERLHRYQDTVAGKNEAITQELEPAKIFGAVRLDKWDNFRLEDKVFESADKHGTDEVKEILTESLKERLTAEALRKKSPADQEALKNYPQLKNLTETHYDWREFNAVRDLSYEATAHLAKLLEKSEELNRKFSSYGFSGAGNSERFRNQSEHSVRAARALDYLTQMGQIAKSEGQGFDDFDNFYDVYHEESRRLEEKKFLQHGDSRDRIYSPEYMAAVVKNFRVLFEKILATDEQTEFFSPDGQYRPPNTEGTPNLLQDIRGEKYRKEGGFREIPERGKQYLDVPTEYIRKAGGGDFSQAMEKTGRVQRDWEQEEKLIAEGANEAVEYRFTEAYKNYYQKKNEKDLADLNSQEKLVGGLRNLIRNLEGIDAKYYAGRIIKLEGDPALIKDVTAVNESHAYEKAFNELLDKINNYLDPKIATLRGEILKIEKGWGFKKDEKKKPLQAKLNHLTHDPVYAHYSAGEYAQKEYNLTDEEMAKLKELHDERYALTEGHRKEDDEAYRLKDSLRYIEIRGIRQVSPLYGQEMSVQDMLALAEKMKEEAEEYLNNLPEDLQTIKDEADRAEVAANRAAADYENRLYRYKI